LGFALQVVVVLVLVATQSLKVGSVRIGQCFVNRSWLQSVIAFAVIGNSTGLQFSSFGSAAFRFGYFISTVVFL
jgi:hypothetical protein